MINRGNRRGRIFGRDGDYRAFLQAMVDATAVIPMRILGWCLMPNHWHLVLWPEPSEWPVTRPANWVELVNEQLDEAMLERVRQCVVRGRPCGEGPWLERAVEELGLGHTLRSPGRPRRAGEGVYATP